MNKGAAGISGAFLAVHTRHQGAGGISGGMARIQSLETASKRAPHPRKGRLSPALRHAIRLRVERGLTIVQACRAAGLSQAGWHKAMQRDAVQEYVQGVQAQYVQNVQQARARHKARAYEVAAELMESAKSEQVRLKAVEFLAGEGRKDAATQVNVQINQGVRGYEYVPPGARVVDVTDSLSGDQDEESEKDQ